MSEQHEHKEMEAEKLPIRTQVTKTIYLRFEPPFASGLTETHAAPTEAPSEFVQRVTGREYHVGTWDEAVQAILKNASEIPWPVTLPTLYKDGEITIAPPLDPEPEV